MSAQVPNILEYKKQKKDRACEECSKNEKKLEVYESALLSMMRIIVSLPLD